MSRHPSYGKAVKSGTKRNVLKRVERVRLLKTRDQWKDRKSLFNLPKTKVSA